MRITGFAKRVRQHMRYFRRAENGNVAIIFAVALIPIVGLVGGSVDYSRASSARAAMQAALDATALAMSKDATTLTTEQLSNKATVYFKAAFNRPEVKNIAISASYSTSGGSSVTVTASGHIGTNFMGILGIDELPIGSSTKTKWGTKRLRLALALDVTGSMASNNKLTTLKIATKNFLTQLKTAAVNNGDVYVSIIPFSKDVNVGAANHGSSWLRWDLWDTVNGTCSNSNYKKKSSCTSHGHSWTPADHSTWNGCVMDRDQNYDTTNTAPSTGDAATLFPAEQYGSCPAALMPLSYDWTALAQKVDDLTPNGNTNQTIGLQWAFQSLTTNSPLAVPAKDPNYQYDDVVILLTDGMNTENRFTSSETSIDQRMEMACTNVKNAGITLYTVLVMAGNATLLKNCASSVSKYHALTSADQMIATFKEIGTELSQLRLAQ
jgi:Flp pilus assembly protein TadG